MSQRDDDKSDEQRRKLAAAIRRCQVMKLLQVNGDDYLSERDKLWIADLVEGATPSHVVTPASRIVEKHRRHVELSPGVGADVQSYALAVCDDILHELNDAPAPAVTGNASPALAGTAQQAASPSSIAAPTMQDRLNWLGNRVLACDYGDNDKPGEIGWRIRHDLLRGPNGERQPAFMYGKSFGEAIDAEMAKEKT